MALVDVGDVDVEVLVVVVGDVVVVSVCKCRVSVRAQVVKSRVVECKVEK